MKTLHVILALQLCTIATLYGDYHEFMNDSDLTLQISLLKKMGKAAQLRINPRSVGKIETGSYQIDVRDATKNKMILQVKDLRGVPSPAYWRFTTDGQKGILTLISAEGNLP